MGICLLYIYSLWPPYGIRQAIMFLPCGFFSLLLFFLAYSQPSHIGCLRYFHTWCVVLFAGSRPHGRQCATIKLKCGTKSLPLVHFNFTRQIWLWSAKGYKIKSLGYQNLVKISVFGRFGRAAQGRRRSENDEVWRETTRLWFTVVHTTSQRGGPSIGQCTQCVTT